jgi:hypothetical protein
VKRSWVVGAGVAVVLALALAAGAFDSGSSASHNPPRLAFVTAGAGEPATVWLANADGQNPRQLGPGTAPLLSPDGTIVAAAATASGGPALRLYGPGAPRNMFEQTLHAAQPLSWSPDSRYLAVALTGRDPASASRSELVVVDTHTGAFTTVAHGQIHGASFAPDHSDRLVYAVARSPALTAVTNIYVANADGSNRRQLTFNGTSLNPVWGAQGIAYNVEQARTNELPAYQLWLASPSGGRRRALTHLVVPALRNGLVPLAFSGGGGRLLAAYIGVDTNQAWAVSVPTGRAHRVLVAGNPVAGGGISSDGGTLLVDSGGFLEPPSFGRIVALQFGGGSAQTLVAHGSDPTWNR